MAKFRFHGGQLVKDYFNVNTVEELLGIISNQYFGLPVSVEHIDFKYYGYDPRLGDEVYIVSLQIQTPEISISGIIGFIDDVEQIMERWLSMQIRRREPMTLVDFITCLECEDHIHSCKCDNRKTSRQNGKTRTDTGFISRMHKSLAKEGFSDSDIERIIQNWINY